MSGRCRLEDRDGDIGWGLRIPISVALRSTRLAKSRGLLARLVACLLLTGALAASERAFAAEGALSHYLPGTAGDLGLAIAPGPGLQLGEVAWIQAGNVGTAVLQGQVDVGLKATVVLDIVSAFYTFEEPFLGGAYTIGASIPFGYAGLTGTLGNSKGASASAHAESFNLSDIAFLPLQMNWSLGQVHLEVYESIIAPTGAYDISKRVNLGRNYWSFDSGGAATWFDPALGTEASLAAGVMVNTRNNDTDYKTGTELHTDFTASQFLSQTFALGFRGYYYQQVSGDSGSGARLGAFQSASLGVGAGLAWTPAFAKGRLALAGKWMIDVYAKNRFDANYGMVTAGWKF